MDHPEIGMAGMQQAQPVPHAEQVAAATAALAAAGISPQLLAQMQEAITRQHEELARQQAMLRELNQPAAAAPAAVQMNPRLTVRLADPRRYAGKVGEDPEEYLNSMEQYFLLGDVHGDHKRIMLAGQYLQDSARDWYMVAYKVSDLVNTQGTFTWLGFKDALRKRFVARDPADVARVKLFRLYQGRLSLRDYTLQFQHLATRSETVSDPDLKVLYLDRMDPAIATQVGMRFPATLADAITMAEQVLVHGRPTSVDYKRASNWASNGQQRNNQRNGPSPMELGAMSRSSPQQKKTPNQKRSLQDMGVTREQYEERKRTGACLSCGGTGHLIRDCPALNRGPGNGTRLRQNQTP